MSKSSIGLVVLVIVLGATAFFLKGGLPTQGLSPQKAAVTQEVQQPPPAPAVATAPAPETPSVTAAAPAPAVETAAPAISTETPAPAVNTEGETAAAPSLLSAPAALKVDVIDAMRDRILGSPDAPVTIIEYASMTCSHCAHFATTILPEVKKRLIETGKAKLIFRDFPLDSTALKAAMMARCAAPDKYFNLVEVIFSNQERWLKQKEDALTGLAQLGSLAGVDGDLFKACTENVALETAILNNLQEAQNKYQIKSTPTFVFNDNAEQLTGAQPVEKFEEIVNKLAKGK